MAGAPHRTRQCLWLSKGHRLAPKPRASDNALARLGFSQAVYAMPDNQSDVNKAYEDGKHRRYGLLFAVNGGAFAIARLLPCTGTTLVVGELRLAMTD
jgi:hypothetical protein